MIEDTGQNKPWVARLQEKQQRDALIVDGKCLNSISSAESAAEASWSLTGKLPSEPVYISAAEELNQTDQLFFLFLLKECWLTATFTSFRLRFKLCIAEGHSV